MANIKSQIKRIKTSEKRRLANKAVKSRIKTEIKKFNAELQVGNIEKASLLYREIASLLDKAASKKVIHPNNAANKKSELSKRLFEHSLKEKSA